MTPKEKIPSAPVNADRANVSSNAAFVQALYRAVAARPASPTELVSICTMLDEGHRSAAVQTVVFSEDAMAHLVQQVYGRFLNRPADGAEVNRLVALLRAGQPLDKMMARILESDDYFALATQKQLGVGPDSHFIQTIYSDLLHRRATSAELGLGLHKLWESGRSQVVLPILRSAEYRTAFIAETYVELLQRPASAQEISPWITWGNSAVDLIQIRIGLLASDEYFNRWK